jgi:hypothetical protein
MDGRENNALVLFRSHVYCSTTQVHNGSGNDFATAVSDNQAEDAWISNAIAYINQWRKTRVILSTQTKPILKKRT